MPSVLSALSACRTPNEVDPALEVAAIFLELTPRRLDQLALAAAREDDQGLFATAHLLAGSAATVGAQAIHAAAVDLEYDCEQRGGKAHVLAGVLEGALRADPARLLEAFIRADQDEVPRQV